MPAFIHSLYIYPIKSCQGIRVDRAELVDTGFKFDRHWMLIDRQGQFLSQRQHSQMACIRTALKGDHLEASTSFDNHLQIPLDRDSGTRTPVRIWHDTCEAAVVSEQASEWFSDVLHTPCELVFLPETIKRRVDPDYASNNEIVGFADGFPLLIVSRAIIDELNKRLEKKVEIDRFRANIVIDGCAAHAEDEWSHMTVNGIEITLAKACSRCVIPSIDQHTAEKHPDLLKTLASYRRREDKIFIGQNGLHHSMGSISTGQAVHYSKK